MIIDIDLLLGIMQLLVVQEKYGALRGKGVWKFPTGTVEEVIQQIDQAAKLVNIHIIKM